MNTLRDEFAMAALQGLLANSGGPIQSSPMSGWTYCNCGPADVAREAYKLADEMMAARDMPAIAAGDTKIDTLELSVRARNCLIAENIFYVSELVDMRETQLLKIPRLGKGTLEEIISALANHGLRLKGMS